jgi:CelD/BcsL family acetyltransferase involved in cellulose biosynthesis
VIAVSDRLAPLTRAWDELATAEGAPPWLRPEWFEAWEAGFGSVHWRIHALWRGGRLAAIAPLRSARFGLASVTNWHTPEFALLAEEDARAELAAAVFSKTPPSISLAFVDRSRRDAHVWEEQARGRGYRVLIRALERSPFVDLSQGWEAYEAGLSRKLRGELRRRRRRLAEQGPVTFEVADGSERLEALLEEGFKVEAAGWKGVRGSSILSQRSTRCFYTTLARRAAERGWLRLAFLRVNGRAIAFDFALEDAGVHALLKTGFDPDYRRAAPGMLLRYEMLSRAFGVGLARYDFLGADEPWKLEWTAATRERSLVQAFAPSIGGRAGWTAYARGRPLAKRVLKAVRR